VLYPGKISQADRFRIGSIGDVFPEDFGRLVAAARDAQQELLLAAASSG
jgi:2-aminoethylphosphonate-pyruvate transaminase